MDLPAALKAEIEQRCTQYGQSALISAARELSRRYREESGRGKRLLTKDTEALAYAVVRMSATFGAVSSALEYTLACFPEGLETALDVGACTAGNAARAHLSGAGAGYDCTGFRTYGGRACTFRYQMGAA